LELFAAELFLLCASWRIRRRPSSASTCREANSAEATTPFRLLCSAGSLLLGSRFIFSAPTSHLNSTRQAVEEISPTLDLLFIDGDHSYAGVKRDFALYSPIVRPAGMIVFHDIAPHDTHKFPLEPACEVDRFWREIKDSYRHTEIIDSPDQGWAGVGVLTV
jgi:predicted O-methyltransferase YrrM